LGFNPLILASYLLGLDGWLDWITLGGGLFPIPRRNFFPKWSRVGIWGSIIPRVLGPFEKLKFPLLVFQGLSLTPLGVP